VNVKRGDQRQEILEALQTAGARGCTSEDLTRICLRYSARIWELRHGLDAYNIETIGRTGTECARYVLRPTIEPLQLILLETAPHDY